MSKVVVIGLDGAGFDLLDQWLNEGDLPTLTRLMKGGAWQRLRSSYPPVTSPAWRCYSTGVNPGKHGVFWWEQFNRDSNSLSVPDSRSFDAKNVWDYLEDGGFSSAVVNMPTTYPPENINGWMISGGGFEDEYTWPPELETELETEIGYRNDLPVHKSLIKEEPDRVEEVNELIDMKFQAAEYLRDTYQPDFLHLSIFITNAIQHYVWGGQATKRMWECVDKNIGEFVEEEDNVIIMSDHGSMQIDTVFHVNSWLEQEGYLKTTKSTSDVLYKLGLNSETLLKFVERLGIKELASSVVPESVIKQIPDSQGGVGRDSKEEKIVWEETSVIASGQGPIYVLAEGSRREEIKAEIQSKLEGMTSPDGRSVVRNVFDASEVYGGRYVEDGPDLVIDQADGVHIPDVVGSPDIFVDPANWKWESENHRDGIFITNGPDVDNVGELDSQPSLYDLTPTILHWYGLSVPSALDGNVLTQVFKTGSAPSTRDVQYSETKIHTDSSDDAADKDDEMLNRLQDLGYLSN
jgi:predicted AlkP superfamily phosphohydrolase/phosphomutase